MKSIITFLRQLPEWIFICLLLGGVFIYHILIGLQGLDISDEGFLLTGYQQIFQHPESIEGMFHLYGTLIIGGIWNSLFGWIGIIGFRVLSSLCMTGIAALVYCICRKFVNRWIILISLFCVMMSRAYLFVFHYNHASAILILTIVFLLLRAIQKESLYHILGAGIVTGMSTLFRLSNICYCGLIVILLPYFLQTGKTKRTFQLLGVALLGYMLGLGLNIMLIYGFGHQDGMAHMLMMMFSTATGDSTHNIFTMIAYYFPQYKDIFYTMGLLLLLPFVLWWNEYYSQSKTIKTLINVLVLLSIYAMMAFIFYSGQMCHYLYFFYAFCCLVYMLYFIRYNESKSDMLYLVVLALCVLFIMPIGSDYGIYNVGAYSIYLPFTIAMGIIWKWVKEIMNKDLQQIYITALFGCICVILIVSLHTISHTCYCDYGSRLEKTHTLKFSIVPTTYSSEMRVQTIDSLLVCLRSLLDEDGELLSYPTAPGLNYLTGIKPYLSSPLIGILPFPVFEYDLNYAENNKELPVVVLVKAPNAIWYNPNLQWESVMDCDDGLPAIKEKNRLFAEFLERNNYRIYYDDSCFQVQVPN